VDHNSSIADIQIDAVAVQQKYAEEREKRLRHITYDPQPELKGKFASFDRDPFADPNFHREPAVDDVDVLIIGGGLGGLMTGVRLRLQGIRNLLMIDKGGDFGGTWYWNRYPGASCDIESYIYLPLLEETGYVPTERYAKASEIRAYLKQLAERYDLYSGALFQTSANELRWNEKECRWSVLTDRNDRISARFVIVCAGLLSNPKLPKIPGIESFRGRSFHTSRWDYDYTGGDQNGNLTGLADKSVAIIGTGSTAIQAVPFLARSAGKLFVVQRTPSSIDPRGNAPTDPAWPQTLRPGWQRARSDNFNSIMSGGNEPVDLVQDGWTDIMRSVPVPAGADPGASAAEEMQIAQLKRMELTRQRIAKAVKDPATAEALKPWYAYFCKRPCFSDEYLDAFNRPNVTLVDTDGEGVERIVPDGLVVKGKKYPVDCIIYSTGFDFLSEFTREAGLEAYGRDGIRLSEHWMEGPRTLYAMQTDRFPNLFFMRLAQASGSFNFTSVAEEQSSYIAHTISRCMAKNASCVEPARDAVDAWVDLVVAKAAPRLQMLKTCTPSYFNYEGDPDRERFAVLSDLCGEGPQLYFSRLRKLRESGDLEGLIVS
jgi:cyclohexanone monooxygenase